jgi:spore maturation protein A
MRLPVSQGRGTAISQTVKLVNLTLAPYLNRSSVCITIQGRFPIMINWIWLGLIILAVVVGGANGRMNDVSAAAFDSAKTAVQLSITLIGIMALWLGLMKLAEEAGLVKFIARLVRPILRRLFPEIPKDHPALGSMTANMAANIFGLGNAATPLGLKAMQDLQELNPEKDIATNAMVTFIVINATSVTIIPATIIGLRSAAGAIDPSSIIIPAIIATGVSTIVGVITAKLLERGRRRRRAQNA